ncbi:MAG: PTS sugar transporter subunit IIA, partial [Paludibacterium sp.]|uniref:PTS sugar transporter subunit IIA n=2 Tax=Paludibacterium sp. TaxID=1917523 RepID=UPI0025D63D77
MTTALLLPQHIQLNASPENRQAAIGLIAERMTACGLALPEYADSLWLRETVTSTELGHGVAVPHGMPQHRHWVQRTGVVVLQMPAGVDWGAGKVHLAF